MQYNLYHRPISASKRSVTKQVALYIHFPWCQRKCPYCDFSSFESTFSEEKYIKTLIQDFKQEHTGHQLISIFIGGGTPSLLSARSIETLLAAIHQEISFDDGIEITLELNPGTSTQTKLKDFKSAGINRLSIGVQSFNDRHLKQLGRIHNASEAKQTIVEAQNAGFENINCDIMHGLPNQTPDEALSDLQTALGFSPQHLSWYELTIEPNTAFAQSPPILPDEKTLQQIQEQGGALLNNSGFKHYEVSAYCKPGFECQHNLNYWQFGDYIGIGAGAHGKITQNSQILRYEKSKKPDDYLRNYNQTNQHILTRFEIPLEFMLNALRLIDGFSIDLFEERTGLKIDTIKNQLEKAQSQDFIEITNQTIRPTKLGQRYLNDCLEIFM